MRPHPTQPSDLCLVRVAKATAYGLTLIRFTDDDGFSGGNWVSELVTWPTKRHDDVHVNRLYLIDPQMHMWAN